MTTAFAQAATPAAPTPHASFGSALGAVEAKLDYWLEGFFYLLPNLLTALVVSAIFIAAAFAGLHLIRRVVQHQGRRDLGQVLGSFVFWAIILFGFLVVITIVLPSMQPVDIFTSLGIGSVAIGFAFKDVLQNWFAGLLILIRRPFHRGDQIKIGDVEGTIQAVETRATLIKTYSGRLVIVPNADIYTRTVTVHTAYEVRRTDITVPIGLEVDLDKAIEVFRKAVIGVEDVLADPEPDILPWEFKDNNVDILVRWWIKSQRAYEVRTRAAVVRAIKLASEAAGIALPADTKISFAETPLILGEAPKRKPTKAKLEDKRPPTPAPEAEAIHKADERRDPEAEKPKSGELSEGTDKVPR